MLIAGVVFLALPNLASAWSRPGHMVTAAVAYGAMKEVAPEALAATVTLLRQHPHYPTRFRPEIERLELSAEEQDIYLFMLASRWADDIRDNENFNRGEWHYINIPYKPEGQPESVKTRPAPRINILTALAKNTKAAADEGSARDRAVALTWLFHLVGDLQQPLHTARIFTTTFPKGDRGGTRFYVRQRDGGRALSLHALWDKLVIGSGRFRDVRNKAIELRHKYPQPEPAELQSGDFDEWAQEGYKLAKEAVYRGGALAGGPTKGTAVVLPADYASTVGAIAEKRVALAGYRLADLLAGLQ